MLYKPLAVQKIDYFNQNGIYTYYFKKNLHKENKFWISELKINSFYWNSF